MLAYAGLQLSDLSEALEKRGLNSKGSFVERLAGKRPGGAQNPHVEYLQVIADITGMPLEFFYVDWKLIGRAVPPDAVVIGRREVQAEDMPPFRDDDPADESHDSEAG